MPVMRAPAPIRFQAGSFLLEALIAILIVALGVLGSVGLLARSMQEVDDARWRGEAAYLANLLISQMWVSDRVTTNLQANYSSTPGTGTPYTDWLQTVAQRLPNAGSYAQVVDVVQGPNPANLASSRVTITLRWMPPGDPASKLLPGCAALPIPCGHKYDIHAIIGAN